MDEKMVAWGSAALQGGKLDQEANGGVHMAVHASDFYFSRVQDSKRVLEKPKCPIQKFFIYFWPS